MNKGFRNWPRPRNKVFVSEPTTLDATNGNRFRHGFGRTPGIVEVTLLCVTANNGYGAGDEIPVTLISREAGTDDDGAPAYAWWKNKEEVRVFFLAGSDVNTTAAASSGTFTPAQWKLIVRCRDLERLT